MVEALEVHHDAPALVARRKRMRPPDVEVEGLAHARVLVVAHGNVARRLVGLARLRALVCHFQTEDPSLAQGLI